MVTKISGFPLLMKLLQVHLSSVAQTAFQRLHWKAEHPFGFSEALDERSSNTRISEDQSGLCHNVTCPEKLLTEEADSVAYYYFFSSSSLLLKSSIFLYSGTNGMGNMPCLFSLGIIRG